MCFKPLHPPGFPVNAVLPGGEADVEESLIAVQPEFSDHGLLVVPGDACERLGGSPGKVGDVSYTIPLFDFFPVMLQFWDGDDEFGPVLKIMWDGCRPCAPWPGT